MSTTTFRGCDEKNPLVVTVDTQLADCEEFSLVGFAGGRFFVPADSNLTTLTFYDAPTEGGTYHESYDGSDGYDGGTTPAKAIVLTVAAGRSYPLPPDLYGAPYVKIKGNADGQVTITPIA